MTLRSKRRKEAISCLPRKSIYKWNVDRKNHVRSKQSSPKRKKKPAYNTTQLGLYETRWTQSVQVRLNMGYLILYLGHEDEDAQHEEGVALTLSQEAHHALISRTKDQLCLTQNKEGYDQAKHHTMLCTKETTRMKI